MKLHDRLGAFIALGQELRNLKQEDLDNISDQALIENAWFTADSVSLAFHGICAMLEETPLRSWVMEYNLEPPAARTVGVAMAGNIPMVGFHDLLSVLISGHHLKFKPSSKDSVLLKFIHQKLLKIDSRFEQLAPVKT